MDNHHFVALTALARLALHRVRRERCLGDNLKLPYRGASLDVYLEVLQARKYERTEPYFSTVAEIFFSVLAAFLKSSTLGASLLPGLFICSPLPLAMRSFFA